MGRTSPRDMSKQKQRELPVQVYAQGPIPEGRDYELLARLAKLGLMSAGMRVEHAPDCGLLTPKHSPCDCLVRYMDEKGTVYQ